MKWISAALCALALFAVSGHGVDAVSEVESLDLPNAPVVVKATDESSMLVDVNGARNSAHVGGLIRDERLNALARGHARDMIARRYFGHETPEGTTFDARFREAGIPYKWAGENLAEIGDEPSAHKALMASPGHRENILEAHYRRIGIAAISVGTYTTLYVQEFSD